MPHFFQVTFLIIRINQAKLVKAALKAMYFLLVFFLCALVFLLSSVSRPSATFLRQIETSKWNPKQSSVSNATATSTSARLLFYSSSSSCCCCCLYATFLMYVI